MRFFFSPVFQQGNLKGKDISVPLTLVFGTLVWRQGCFSGDCVSLFQSLPRLFPGDINLKNNLEWRKGQKKNRHQSSKGKQSEMGTGRGSQLDGRLELEETLAI